MKRKLMALAAMSWRLLLALALSLAGLWSCTLPVLFNCHDPAAASDMADCQSRAQDAVMWGVLLLAAGLTLGHDGLARGLRRFQEQPPALAMDEEEGGD